MFDKLRDKLSTWSVTSAIALVPFWVWLVVALGLIMFGGWVNGEYRWKPKYERLENSIAQKVSEAQAAATTATAKNTDAESKIDKEKFQELQDAKVKINDLRAALTAGNLRLRQSQRTGNNAENCTGGILGDESTPDASGGGRPVESYILDLGEAAKTAIAQRDYLREKNAVDEKTVNDFSVDGK
jgi:hypothetical protein